MRIRIIALTGAASLVLAGCTGDPGAAGGVGGPGAMGAPGTGTAGGNGADGTNGANGATGTNGTNADAGTNGKDLINVTKIPSNATAPTDASAAAWRAFKPQVTITSVTIASPPVVKFTVKDANGNPVVGLGNKSQSATATVAGMTNLNFTLAKLVPGASGAPSKWVSYLVVKPPSVAEKTATPPASSCDAATNATWCGTYPTTEKEGTLVDNGDGSYQYTFLRNITQAATIANSLIDSVNPTFSKKADLGDLTYDANLTHRLGVIISGAAPGTGSNTPDAKTVTPGVNIADPGNFTYDFKPAGGAVTDTRDIVNINTCGSCHQGKGLAHGGARKDPKLCVTCHTDQVKYSFNMGPVPMDAAGNLTGASTGTSQEKRAEQAIVDGRAVGNFPNYIHKLHLGKGGAWGGANGNKGLHKLGYNFNVDNGAMKFNENEYPQDIRNCGTCHDGAATGAKAAKDGDNWKVVPSRLACGACHDGIDFATGLGVGIAGKVNHDGGTPHADTECALACHTPTKVAGYHTAQLPAISDATKRTLKAAFSKVDVSAVDGSVTVNFTLMDGANPVTDPAAFKNLAFTLAKLMPAADGASTHWVSYTGRFRSKDVAQVPVNQGYSEGYTDTTAAPNLTNVGAGVWKYKFKLLNFVTPGDIRTGITDVLSASCSGYVCDPSYPKAITYEPALTHRVGMMVQTNPAVAVDATDATDAYVDFVPDGNKTAATRNIVTSENCTSCHAGRKWHKGYNTQLCVTCHNGDTFDPYTGTKGPATVDLQVLVHKVHMFGSKYVVNGEAFGSASPNAGYPGEVKNCQACHVESNAAAKNAANWRTTPTKAACGACHDDSVATAHINSQISGGVQMCTVCHGAGKAADVKMVHAQ